MSFGPAGAKSATHYQKVVISSLRYPRVNTPSTHGKCISYRSRKSLRGPRLQPELHLKATHIVKLSQPQLIRPFDSCPPGKYAVLRDTYVGEPFRFVEWICKTRFQVRVGAVPPEIGGATTQTKALSPKPKISMPAAAPVSPCNMPLPACREATVPGPDQPVSLLEILHSPVACTHLI